MVTARVMDEDATHIQPPGPRPHGPQHVLIPSETSWAELYPFDSHWLNVGTDAEPMWLHYVDEGPRDAPIVVMCHGNPTWSFMYRDVIKALSDRYRCIVPDHMGCGLSDRPQHWPYRLRGHADNLGKLIAHIAGDQEQVSLIMHDWGGMIGSTWAVEHPHQVRSMTPLNTAAFLGKLPKRIKTVRIPVFGPTAVLGFNGFVRAAMVSCTHRKDALSEQDKAGYLAPYSNPHDRIATLRFVEDVPQKAGHPTWDLVDEVDGKLHLLKDKPMLVCWGNKDWCFTPTFCEGWHKRFPDAEVHAWDDVAHFTLEDAGERVLEHLVPFLDRVTADERGGAS
jgi:pimeloyl-ACP methyl ester carboxylesterase